jgi:hypothetical protein
LLDECDLGYLKQPWPKPTNFHPLVELVSVKWLKPHEEIIPENFENLFNLIIGWNAYKKPILVDRETGTILDGHHRYSIALHLGLSVIPVRVQKISAQALLVSSND